MSHLDEGTLHEFLDGEFAPGKAATLRRHIDQCSLCQGRLNEARALRSESDSLIESLEPSPSLRRVWRPLTPTRPATASARLRTAPLKKLMMVGSLAAAITLGIYLGTTGFAGGRGDDGARNLAVNDVDQPTHVEGSDQTRETKIAVESTAANEAQIDSSPRAQEQPPRRLRKAEPPKASISAEEKSAEGSAESIELAQKFSKADWDKLPGSADSVTMAVRKALAILAAHHDAVPPSPTPTAAASSRARAESRSADQRPKDTVTVRVANAEDAKRALGRDLLAIKGLKPTGYEIIGPVVATVYRVELGVIRLAQWRAADSTASKLYVPKGTPADSLTAWKERIR